jgi:hypothetical protein
MHYLASARSLRPFFSAAMVVSAVAGLTTAYFIQAMWERLNSGGWHELQANRFIMTVLAASSAILIRTGTGEALPWLGALILVVFLADLAIVMAFGRPHVERAAFLVGLMLLFGLAFVTGIPGRIVGGAFGAWAIALISVVGDLIAGQARRGLAAVRVGALFVVISKRTLKGDGHDNSSGTWHTES